MRRAVLVTDYKANTTDGRRRRASDQTNAPAHFSPLGPSCVPRGTQGNRSAWAVACNAGRGQEAGKENVEQIRALASEAISRLGAGAHRAPGSRPGPARGAPALSLAPAAPHPTR